MSNYLRESRDGKRGIAHKLEYMLEEFILCHLNLVITDNICGNEITFNNGEITPFKKLFSELIRPYQYADVV